MAGKLTDILNQGDCIPEEMLLNYIAGSLPESETHLVEKHLLECEFCNDALEGLRMLGPAKSKALVAELQSKIDARLQSNDKHGRIIPFKRTDNIAAVIALFILFGGAYLYLKNVNEKKELAQNISSQPETITDSISPQLIPQSNSVEKAVEAVAAQPQLRAKEKQVSTELKEIPQSDEVSNLALDVVTDDAKQKNDNSVARDEVAKAETEESLTYSTSAKSPSGSEKNQGSVAGAPSVAVQEEMVARKSRENKNASAEFAIQKKVSSDSLNPQMLFNLGKTNYQQKKYSEAADDFEILMNDSTTAFYDDAKWMLANSYMRIHKNAKARKLLKEISNSNSVYKKEAHGLLQEMQ